MAVKRNKLNSKEIERIHSWFNEEINEKKEAEGNQGRTYILDDERAAKISAILTDLRNENDLTLENLAELTGISKESLTKYEKANKYKKDGSAHEDKDSVKGMRLETLVLLANFYDVPVDYIIGRTESTSRMKIGEISNNIGINEDSLNLLLKTIKEEPTFKFKIDNITEEKEYKIAGIISLFLGTEYFYVFCRELFKHFYNYTSLHNQRWELDEKIDKLRNNLSEKSEDITQNDDIKIKVKEYYEFMKIAESQIDYQDFFTYKASKKLIHELYKSNYIFDVIQEDIEGVFKKFFEENK